MSDFSYYPSDWGFSEMNVVHPLTCEVSPGVILSYELIGSGDQKVLFIMGFLSESRAFARQIEYFKKCPEFQICIFDNRGVGRSSAPFGFYSTKLMAKDAIALMNHLQWERAHIVGVSMGGMIAQEIALEVPLRVQSLALIVTHAGGIYSGPTWLGAKEMIKLNFLAKTIDDKIKCSFKILYAQSNLVNQDLCSNLYLFQQVRRKVAIAPKIAGMIGHYIASNTHYVSFEHLYSLRRFPFGKLVIGASEVDQLVDKRNSIEIHNAIGGSLFLAKGSHGIITECGNEVNLELKNHFLRNVMHKPDISIISSLPFKYSGGCSHRGTCFLDNIKWSLLLYVIVSIFVYFTGWNDSEGYTGKIPFIFLLLRAGTCVVKYVRFHLHTRKFSGIAHIPVPSILLFIYSLFYLYFERITRLLLEESNISE